MITLKVTKKKGFTLSLKDVFLEKPYGGASNDLPPAFLELTETDHRCHSYQRTRAWVKEIEFRFIKISYSLVDFHY